MDQPKCAHDKCHCKGMELKEDGFCSPSCREGRTGADARCDCGHPDCR